MKIKFKENGVDRELEVGNVVITDKDGINYCFCQDKARGIEVLGDRRNGRLYLEPYTSNKVTILML